jgi:hypothetical protein
MQGRWQELLWGAASQLRERTAYKGLRWPSHDTGTLELLVDIFCTDTIP